MIQYVRFYLNTMANFLSQLKNEVLLYLTSIQIINFKVNIRDTTDRNFGKDTKTVDKMQMPS